MSYSVRIEKLQKKVKGAGCDAFLVEDATSLSYLTGCHFSTGILLVTSQESHMIVDGRYLEIARKGLEIDVHLLNDKILHRLLLQLDVRTLGFSKEVTTYERYIDLQQKLPAKSTLKAIEDPVMGLRMIKDATEMQRLRDAAELGSKGFDFVLSRLREGITERHLATQLELFWREEGGKGPGFEPIIAFGKNSSMPHHRSGDTPLKRGDLVLIDIGVILDEYHSDMTRCLFYGKPKPKLQEIYEIVRKAQEKALSLCQPGVTAGELDHAARSFIEKAGYGKQFSHSLGHGVGREIHEAPRLTNRPPFSDFKLKKGMVVTIEPGVYLPGVGGIRIEDTVILTAKGCENLSRPSKEMVSLG